MVSEHAKKILAAAEARKAALGLAPAPASTSSSSPSGKPANPWGDRLGIRPVARKGKGKGKGKKGKGEEALGVEVSVVAPEPEAYCPELQAFLVRLADGLKAVQEALKQRQVRHLQAAVKRCEGGMGPGGAVRGVGAVG